MDSDKKVELFDDATIKAKVEEIWEKVFSASNKVIKDAGTYGFYGMDVFPSPTIHQMLIALQIFSSVFEILIGSSDKFEVSYDETRLLLNAKMQVVRMERLAIALKANNKEDYYLALAELEKQVAF